VVAEMRLVDTEWEGQAALLVALRDITERKHMEAEIRWRADTLEALHETALELATSKALPELLRAIADRASHLLGAKGAAIFLYRPAEDALEPVFWHNLASPPSTATFVRKGEGVCGRVLESGQPMIVNDYDNWEGRLPQRITASFDACTVVPILWDKRPLGVLLVGDDAPRTFGHDDIALLERFTPLAAAALEQRRLLEEAEMLYARAQQDAETKSTLLKEVNHRVKNNLSAIIGMLYAERRHASAKEHPLYQATIQDLINRMQSLATVHSLLTASEWQPVRLSELAEHIIDSVLQTLQHDKRVTVQVTPSPIRVPPAQANSLAMMLNEMSTNTVKYALQDKTTCTIAVDIAMHEREPLVLLTFRDDGPGYPEDVLRFKRHNTGLYLIQTIVTRDLRGVMQLSNDAGAVTAIRFPAPESTREESHA
jgi:two-component sensor histidine kinase